MTEIADVLLSVGIGPGSQMLLLFFILLLLRVPVAFSLGLSAIYAMFLLGFGLDLVGDLITTGISKYALLAIPFFILAGNLMGELGIAERMIRFFRVLIGKLPGGMGIVGTIVCLFWGAVSGSGPASVAAIGPLIIKGMVEDGYDKHFAAGLVCTGAALSIVIPPSIGLLIYGVIAEVSIGDLFIAAIVPGVFMGIIMLLTLPFAKRRAATPQPTGSPSLDALIPEHQDISELPYLQKLGKTFIESFWGLMTPVVILGGIYSGAFTPTEAALVATVYAVVIGGVVYRTLTFKGFYQSVVNSASSSAVVMLVVAYASLFGWVVNVDNLITQYSSGLLNLSDNPWIILFVIMLVMLISGMFMDAVTIMFITLPIFLPVARELDWNLIWFGVVVMINLAIGLFTPPVGINLYVAANIMGSPLEKVAKGALPFLLTCVIGLVVIAMSEVLMLRILTWLAII